MAMVNVEWTEVSEQEVMDLPPGRWVRKEVQYWTDGQDQASGGRGPVVRFFQPADEVESTKRTFRIPNNVYRAAQEKAGESGQSLSDVVRRLLREYAAGDRFAEWAEERAAVMDDSFRRGYAAGRAESAK